jgi:hypothetical protein
MSDLPPFFYALNSGRLYGFDMSDGRLLASILREQIVVLWGSDRSGSGSSGMPHVSQANPPLLQALPKRLTAGVSNPHPTTTSSTLSLPKRRLPTTDIFQTFSYILGSLCPMLPNLQYPVLAGNSGNDSSTLESFVVERVRPYTRLA